MKIINLNPSRLVEWHIATWCYMSAVSRSNCWMVTIFSNIVNHCIIALGLVDLKKLKLHQVDKRRSNYKCMIYIYANLHAYSCVCVHVVCTLYLGECSHLKKNLGGGVSVFYTN